MKKCEKCGIWYKRAGEARACPCASFRSAAALEPSVEFRIETIENPPLPPEPSEPPKPPPVSITAEVPNEQPVEPAKKKYSLPNSRVAHAISILVSGLFGWLFSDPLSDAEASEWRELGTEALEAREVKLPWWIAFPVLLIVSIVPRFLMWKKRDKAKQREAKNDPGQQKNQKTGEDPAEQKNQKAGAETLKYPEHEYNTIL